MQRAHYLIRHLLRIALVLLALESVAFGQITNVTDDQSTPTPGTGHDYIKMLSETVNPANGSVSVRIQVPMPKGRGLTLPFSFAYDSNGVHHVGYLGTGQGGWFANLGFLASGGWTYSVPLLTEVYGQESSQGLDTCEYLSDYVFQDPTGSRHALGIASIPPNYYSACEYYPVYARLSGGDDYVQASISTVNNSVLIADADGTVYNFAHPGAEFTSPPNQPSFQSALPTTIVDRNGNTIQLVDNGGGAFTVTDGIRSGSLLASNGFGATGNTITVSGLSPYILTWTTAPSSFSVDEVQTPTWAYCRGINGEQADPPVIKEITLPNGQQYQFQYDSTSGLLNTITYPSGGSVNYTWALNSQSEYALFPDTLGNPASCGYRYGSFAVSSRSVSFDGQTTALQQTFTYSTTWSSTNPGLWTQKSTKVVTQDLLRGVSSTTNYTYTPVIIPIQPNDTSYIADQAPVEQTTTVNDWNENLLETVTKSWIDQYEMQGQQVVDNGTVTSDQFFVYGPGAQITDKYECGAGQTCYSATQSSPPTAYARHTQDQYHNFGNTSNYPSGPSIFDRPDSVTISGVTGSGNTGTAAQTIYTYDGNGNATSKTEKCLYNCTADIVTGYQYNIFNGQPDGQLHSMTDARGNTTTYGYECSDTYLSQINYPTTSSNGQSHIVNFQYDCASGLLTQSTDQNGNPTLYDYTDPLRRLKSITYPPGGGQTTYIYTDYPGSGTPVTSSIETDKLIEASHPYKTYQILDGLGLVTQTQTGDQQGNGNICVDTTYDGLERVLTVSNPHYNCTAPYSYLTTYAYDAVGCVTSVLYPDGNAATTSYNGLSSTLQDAGGRWRTLQKDELGHLISVIEDPVTAQNPNGLNYVTNYPGYSALDDLLTVAQGSQTRSFSYDSFSRLTSAANPESGTINYTYDGNGNMISKADARGITCYGKLSGDVCDGTGYDELNRVLFKTYSDTSTVRACYAYDGFSPPFGDSTPGAVGHLTGSWSVNHDGTVVAASEWYNFDAMGRAWAGKQCTPGTCGVTSYPLTMTYNYLGNETSFSDPTTARSTSYDSTDRLQLFTATLSGMGNQTLLSNIQYGPYGLTQATLGSGSGALTETRGYSPTRTWLQSLGVGSVYSLGLTYYGNGNVWTANDSENGNWTYAYDGVNRLQTASVTGHTFSYYPDQYGNMYCSDSGGSPCTPMHGTPPTQHMNFKLTTNQIWDDGDGVYQYDAAGNLTQDGTHGYVYDAENRITCVLGTDETCTSASAMLYLYDADGMRVGKQQADTLEDYVYDPQGHITSVYYNGAASASRAELYTPEGRHIATWNPSMNYGPLFFNVADWLGTHRVRTDSTGTAREWCTDTPYGMNLACTPPPDTSPMHFTGKQRDYESGLDDFGARYFGGGNSLGRFMTPDPGNAGSDPRNPQSWNAYAYTGNNPVSGTDLLGLDYSVCIDDGNGGQTCTYVPNDYQFQQALQNPGAGITITGDDSGGTIWATDENGLQVAVGTYTQFVGPGDEGGGLQEDYGTELALAGLVRGLASFFGGATTGAGASGVWSLGWATRGNIIEQMLGKNLPSNFPTIDAFSNGVATSIKSIDLTAASYQAPDALAGKLTGYVDKVAEFSGGESGGIIIKASEVTSKVLKVAVPEGGVSAAQQAVINRVAAEAVQKGVTVVVVPVH